jgi:hypothetical protein
MNKTILLLSGSGDNYENILYFNDLEGVEFWLKNNDAFTEGYCSGNWYKVFVEKDFSKYLERKALWGGRYEHETS